MLSRDWRLRLQDIVESIDEILLAVNFPLMGLSYLTQYDCSTLICDRILSAIAV